MTAPAQSAIAFPGKYAFINGFTATDDLTTLGHNLIREHASLQWLDGFTVKFLWKEKGGQKGGLATLGKCVLLSGLARHFGESDYVIWIAADHARAWELDDGQLEALLYHELLHCELITDENSDEVRAGVRGHDAEVFFDEIAKYGLWRESLTRLRQAVLIPEGTP